MNLIWHYSVGVHLPKILADGFIKVCTAGVRGWRDSVWFSTNAIWEQTANKMVGNEFGDIFGLNKEETHDICGGLVRIGVLPHVAPHDWRAFKRLSGIRPAYANGLYQKALALGGRPGEWRVSFAPVSKEHWQTIELWDGERWTARHESNLLIAA